MYIKKMHILIEQKLQNIGVFAYMDNLKEEIDLQIDTAVIKLIESQFSLSKNLKTGYEDNQKNKDRLKELEVRNLRLTPVKVDNEYEVTLPSNYYHLISDISEFLYICSTKNVELGTIKKDVYYLVNKGVVEYNGIIINEGSYFKGLDNFPSYSYTTVKPVILELSFEKSLNILTELENYGVFIKNSLTTSTKDRLVSTIAGNKLIIFSPKSFVNSVLISYIKEPLNVNYNFKTFTSSSTLIIGKEYEIVSGNITYNAINYSYSNFNKLESFTVISGLTTFTGTGKVRLKEDGDLELNNITCYLIIDEVANALAILSEQNQQKILNMKQNGIPS